MNSSLLPQSIGYIIFFSLIGLTAYLFLKAKSRFLRLILVLQTILFMRYSLSLFLIEKGHYIVEQFRNGYQNNALIYYCGFFLISLLTCYYSLKDKEVKLGEVNRDSIYVQLFTVFFLVQLFTNVFIRLHFDPSVKFNFFSQFPFERFMVAFSYFYESFYIWSLFNFPKFAPVLIIQNLVLGLVRYNDFDIIRDSLQWFMVVLYLQGKLSKKIFFSAFPIIILALGYKVIKMDGKFENLFNRFVMDAHLLWGAINVQGRGDHHFFENFRTYFFNFDMVRTNHDYGVGELMSALSKKDFVKHFIDRGIRFSGGYPSILIYKLGLIPSLILHVPFMLVFYQSIYYFYKLALKLTPISYFLVFKILSHFNDFIAMGEYSYFRFKYFALIAFTGLWIKMELKYKDRGLEIVLINLRNFKEKFFYAPGRKD